MSLPATVRQHLAARLSQAALFDVGLAVATFIATIAMLAHGGVMATIPGPHEVNLPAVVLAAASTLPLLAWRRHPLAVFAVTGSASVVLAALGFPVALVPGPVAALYLLASGRTRHRAGRRESGRRWTWPMTATVAGLLTARLVATAGALDRFPSIELLHTALAWAGAWLAGERTRLRHEQIAELRDRAQSAERDTERERLLAVAEERARIARDLHDSAGHAISVIAVRAGAARLRYAADPDRGMRTLEAIEQLARQTAEDIDRMVGTLRQDDRSNNGTVEAPAGLASLDTLVAHHTAAGFEVTVETIGAPTVSGGPIDQAAYRILQEALTNAARHGSGGAHVLVEFTDDAIDLAVTNPVPAGGEPRTSAGGGHGLIGMRERAILLGGSLNTWQASGIFRVRAHIPYAGRLHAERFPYAGQRT